MITAHTRIFVLTFLLGSMLIHTGCKKKGQAPPPPAPAAAKTAAVAPVAAPVQKQASSAKAGEASGQGPDFTNKKDPFKPFVTVPVEQNRIRSSVPGAPARSGELLPIQSYDVSKFTVSGIIAGLKENTALIIDPARRGYVVKQGMLIGINDGRISKINATSIEIVESYRDDNGRMRKRTIVLALPKKK